MGVEGEQHREWDIDKTNNNSSKLTAVDSAGMGWEEDFGVEREGKELRPNNGIKLREGQTLVGMSFSLNSSSSSLAPTHNSSCHPTSLHS